MKRLFRLMLPTRILVVLLTLLVVAALLLLHYHAFAQSLIENDEINGPVLVKHSGSELTWTICADTDEPGDYANYEIYELITGALIVAGSEEYVNDETTVQMTLPRAGIYGGRAQSCTYNSDPDEDDLCSEWRSHDDFDRGEVADCGDGYRYAFSIIAPPGAPEF